MMYFYNNTIMNRTYLADLLCQWNIVIETAGSIRRTIFLCLLQKNQITKKTKHMFYTRLTRSDLIVKCDFILVNEGCLGSHYRNFEKERKQYLISELLNAVYTLRLLLK